MFQINNPPPIDKDVLLKYNISIKDLLVRNFMDVKDQSVRDKELRDALIMSCGTVETMRELLEYQKGIVTSLVETDVLINIF